MDTRLLEKKYIKELNKKREEISKFRIFKESDETSYIREFFSNVELIEQIYSIYQLERIPVVTAYKSAQFARRKSEDLFVDEYLAINDIDPTPFAKNLEESTSLLLTLLTSISEIEKISKMELKSIPEIAKLFFIRYNHLSYDVKIDNEKIISFDDGTKGEFIKSMNEFSKKINKIKSVNPEITKLVNNVKVDLASLILNTRDETSFDFKTKLDQAREIAKKAKPLIPLLVTAISLAASVKGLLV